MSMRKLISILILCLSCFFVSFSYAANSGPTKLTRSDTCAADGMILMDFAGPKAQILWKNGKRTYYCEAREAFNVWLDPIKQKRIAAFYVQDFSGLHWGIYAGHWIKWPLNKAGVKQIVWFVVDSRKLGAMGISYISFTKQQDAVAFQKKYGGHVLTFKQITEAVLQNTRQLMIKRPNMYGPGMMHKMPVPD